MRSCLFVIFYQIYISQRTKLRHNNLGEMKVMLVIAVSVLLGSMSFDSNRCEGYRILGIFPLPARSHFMFHEALMKGLARKGHQVEVVSPFPQKKPLKNYADIVNLPSPLLVNNLTYTRAQEWMNWLISEVITEFGYDLCKHMGHPKMLQLIRNPPRDPPYDLLITEPLGAHCFMALGHHLKVPTIGSSSTALYPWLNDFIANPHNLAFVPNNFGMDYAAPMSFWQRLHNTVFTIFVNQFFRYYTLSQDDLIRKYLGDDAPGVRESERSLSLILSNSHPSLHGPKPITTALIEVGGLHIRDDGPELPRDIVEWMDNSTEGFIYVTFGSMVLIESFPEETILTFYRSLGKLAPMRVLVKIAEPKKLPPGLPKNFRTFSWITQYKVLKHKNIKAFITHGGLMGTQEAIHCAVPLIGIPLFADQFPNLNIYVSKKIAVQLNYKDFTEETLDKALNEILYNPVYRKAMRDVSARFSDRPMSPVDTATWWVEYVVRHGGKGLRSPAMDLAWWQIELLDVYAFLLLIASSLIFLTIFLVRRLVKMLAATAGVKVTLAKKLT